MSSLSILSTTNNPADPILRLLQSLDDNDRTMLNSALTADCALDQSGLTAITGVPMPTVTGQDAIAMALLDYGVGAKMDTGHVASNFRVSPKGDAAAEVTCYTIGSHYRKGEGLDMEKKGFMAGSRWKGEVVKEGEEWKIRKAELKVLWTEGDMSILKLLMP